VARRVLLLLALLATPLWAGTALQINRPQANVRAEPSAQAERVATLQQGDEVELVDQRGDWRSVRTADGQEGWLKADLVAEQWVVTTAAGRVRSAGNTSAEVVAAVAAGDVVLKLSQRGNWIEVSLADGNHGWLAAGLAKPKTVSFTPASRPRPASGAERSNPAPTTVRADAPGAAANPAAAGSDTAAVRANLYAAGLQDAIAGNYEAALSSFEAVLAQDPQNLNALFNAEKAHRQLGQNEQALRKLYRILALNQGRNRRDLFRELGEVYAAEGLTDSAAKYQALFRGDDWTEPDAGAKPEASLASESEPGPRRSAGRIPWAMIAAGGGAAAVLALVLFLLLRRRSAAEDQEPEIGTTAPAAGRGRFAQTMRQTAARPPAVDRGAEEELDRQIEAKRAELRQSTEAFLGGAAAAKGARTEDQHLEELLGHLDGLRAALAMQDERERVYADLVRLQNMKLDVLARQLALLRRRPRP
jgi:uncharacterized protein YgiM (DUF1202 family)